MTSSTKNWNHLQTALTLEAIDLTASVVIWPDSPILGWNLDMAFNPEQSSGFPGEGCPCCCHSCTALPVPSPTLSHLFPQSLLLLFEWSALATGLAYQPPKRFCFISTPWNWLVKMGMTSPESHQSHLPEAPLQPCKGAGGWGRGSRSLRSISTRTDVLLSPGVDVHIVFISVTPRHRWRPPSQSC